MLNIRVSRLDRENALSSRYALRACLISVVQVDAQDLCKTVADFGRDRNHSSDRAEVEGMSTEADKQFSGEEPTNDPSGASLSKTRTSVEKLRQEVQGVRILIYPDHRASAYAKALFRRLLASITTIVAVA